MRICSPLSLRVCAPSTGKFDRLGKQVAEMAEAAGVNRLQHIGIAPALHVRTAGMRYVDGEAVANLGERLAGRGEIGAFGFCIVFGGLCEMRAQLIPGLPFHRTASALPYA